MALVGVAECKDFKVALFRYPGAASMSGMRKGIVPEYVMAFIFIC